MKNLLSLPFLFFTGVCQADGRIEPKDMPQRGTEKWIADALQAKPINVGVPFLRFAWTDHAESVRLFEALQKTRGLIDPTRGTFIVYGGGQSYIPIAHLVRQIGVTHMFCPDGAHDGMVDGVRVVPILFAPRTMVEPAAHKDILYSFVGAVTSQTRAAMVASAPKDAGDVKIVTRTGYHSDNSPEERERNKREYIDITSRSRFGLCPRGDVLGSFRFTELLGAGTIPIVLADGIKLPHGIDWNRCVIFVPERDAHRIDEIIRTIPREKEEEMRAMCLAIHAALTRDPACFVRHFFDGTSII